jgi:DNA-binding NtrC family response regulator
MRSFVGAISGFVHSRESPSLELNRKHDSDRSIRVVALLAEDSDQSVIIDVCQQNQWELFMVETVEDIRQRTRQIEPQIVLIDRDIAGGSWRVAMSSLTSCSTGTCITLVSSVMDGYLWNEVVRNGGYDVLIKPLQPDEVYRIVKLARCYSISVLKSRGASRK